MEIHILGTRGSAPVANESCRRYGGNSHCALVKSGQDVLVLDAGSGILAAGGLLEGMRHTGETHILLSHYHMDHLVGLPMCRVLFRPGAQVHLHGMAYQGKNCGSCLREIFVPPLWPVEIAQLPAEVTFHTVAGGQHFRVGGFAVTALALNHPGGALGYRVEKEEKSFCYLFDHEQDGQEAAPVGEFIRGCQLLLCDAPYTRESYPASRGYGHSSAGAMLNLAMTYGVQRVLLSHHLPSATDERIDAMQRAVETEYPGLPFSYAKEGEVITL